METSVSSKNNLISGIFLTLIAAAVVYSPVESKAGILVQTPSGVWVDVNGFQLSSGQQTMPSIVVAPEARSSGFMMQRAMAWGNYRRANSATGFLLVDPAGSGALTATTPRQAAVRSHVARANAYRLEYFGK